jgi:phage tail protein X
MKIDAFEILTVQGELITADLIIWRRYRCRTYGAVEALLDLNPHLAEIHRTTPFIPPGTQVRIPIDFEMLKGRPKPIEQEVVWGVAKGYRL